MIVSATLEVGGAGGPIIDWSSLAQFGSDCVSFFAFGFGVVLCYIWSYPALVQGAGVHWARTWDEMRVTHSDASVEEEGDGISVLVNSRQSNLQ